MSKQSDITCVLSPYVGDNALSRFKEIGLDVRDLALLSVDGETYVVPVQGKPAMSYFSVGLAVGGVDVLDGNHSSEIVVEDGRNVSVRASFGLGESDTVDCAAEVYVGLYRVGESCPVALYRKRVEDYDDIEFDFTASMSQCEAGTYFLLMGNLKNCDLLDGDDIKVAGNYRLAYFSLLAGSGAEIPGVNKVQADVLTSSDKHSLTVKVALKEALPGSVKYTLVCYDSDLNYMGKSTVSGHRKNLAFTIDSNNMWSEGEYIAVVVRDELLVVGMRFVVDGDGRLVESRISDKDSEIDDMLTCAQSVRAWETIGGIQGFVGLKKYALELCRIHRLNRMRRKSGMPALQMPVVIGCVGKYSQQMKRLILSLSEILNSGNTEIVDASRLIHISPEDGVPFSTPNNPLDGDAPNILLYNLSCLSSGCSAATLSVLRGRFENDNVKFLCLLGSEDEIDALRNMYDFIGEHLSDDRIVNVSEMSARSAIRAVECRLHDARLRLSPQARTKIVDAFTRAESLGMSEYWNYAKIVTLVQNMALNMVQRLTQSSSADGYDSKMLSSVLPQDVILPDFDGENADSFDKCVAELNAMVGLENVKLNMVKAANMVRFNLMRVKQGKRQIMQGNHHMIFTGNPGTGKTTVAKLVGRIYHSLGLLSKGDVIVTERSKIVGRYLGETERNVQLLLKEARGNVLFVDEAYTLSTDADDSRDFGRRVIEGLLTVLSQNNPDMIIIFAGYERDMERMMLTNQGLRGRFPLKLRFDDYDSVQLYEIAMRLIRNEDFSIDDDAREELRYSVKMAYDGRNEEFSNARWVEQFVRNGIFPAVASRVMETFSSVGECDFSLIKSDDVKKAAETYCLTQGMARRRVGF